MRFFAKIAAIIVSAVIGLALGSLLAAPSFWPNFIREVLPTAFSIALAFVTADLSVWKKD